MFKKPFSFKGRIARTEYALSLILFVLVFFMSAFLFFPKNNYLYYIPMTIDIWFILAQAIKRCHDFGERWWFFSSFEMFYQKGDEGVNKYGDKP